jgi:hypothetical protein
LGEREEEGGGRTVGVEREREREKRVVFGILL